MIAGAGEGEVIDGNTQVIVEGNVLVCGFGVAGFSLLVSPGKRT